jgi:hypothetical protein
LAIAAGASAAAATASAAASMLLRVSLFVISMASGTDRESWLEPAARSRRGR